MLKQGIIDDSHRGTIATMMLSFLGYIGIDTLSQIVFMVGTIVTGTLTSIYTIKKIKKLNNDENNTKKP